MVHQIAIGDGTATLGRFHDRKSSFGPHFFFPKGRAFFDPSIPPSSARFHWSPHRFLRYLFRQ